MSLITGAVYNLFKSLHGSILKGRMLQIFMDFTKRHRYRFALVWILLLTVGLAACTRTVERRQDFLAVSQPTQESTPVIESDQPEPTEPVVPTAVIEPAQPTGLPEPTTEVGGAPVEVVEIAPTAELIEEPPALLENFTTYSVVYGDSLAKIAYDRDIPVLSLIRANNIPNPNYIYIGQVIVVPFPSLDRVAPGFQIIPNSELIASPGNASFDTAAFVKAQGGYLARYKETLNGKEMNGPEIVDAVARDYSVNPRLLLALIEHHSGWVTDPNPQTRTMTSPLGRNDPQRTSLSKQLVWAANQLNYGYYAWRVGGFKHWALADGAVIPTDREINPGTAAIQHLYSNYYTWTKWNKTVSEKGIYKTYTALFGQPSTYAYSPIVPADLEQPTMQLPFEEWAVWAFTGGPHGSYGDGAAWGALDFSPPGYALGCYYSYDWVVAVADGPVVYSDDGRVVQDLDGDGLEQTGWTVLYLHIATDDRVENGAYLEAGDRIGHPSCEGGISTGTHVHIARRYNGEWIPADQDIPFNLDGWISYSNGIAYDGKLVKGSSTVFSFDGRSAYNGIQR